jgi:hypothetical protein
LPAAIGRTIILGLDEKAHFKIAKKIMDAMTAPMNCCKGSLYRKKPMAKSNFTLAFSTSDNKNKNPAISDGVFTL